MAHLTTDGTHLNAVTKGGGTHLAVVTLKNNWRSKELIVTPSESKYIWASACGKETNPSATNYGTEMQTLMGYVIDDTGGAAWRTGEKALFSYCTRSYSLRRMMSTATDYPYFAETAVSALALKFKLRFLPFGKMAKPFHIYLRLHCPSLVLSTPDGVSAVPSVGTIGANDSAEIEFRFFDGCPAGVNSIGGSGRSYFNLAGKANNGAAAGRVIADPTAYDPYDVFNSTYDDIDHRSQYNPLWLYTTGATPSPYCYDYEIPTGDTAKTFLAGAPRNEVWLGIVPRRVAPSALPVGASLLLYVQRVELRIVCSADAF